MPQPENSAEKEFESMIKEKKQQLAEHSLAQNLQTTCQAKSNTSVNHVAPKNVFHLVKQRENAMLRATPALQVNLAQRYVPNHCSTEMNMFTHQVFCGQFSKDGSAFMTACQDQYVRLFHSSSILQSNYTKKPKPFAQIQAKEVGWSIVDCNFSPDQQSIVYSSWSPYIYLYKLGSKKHESLDLKPSTMRFCAFSVRFTSDSKEILVGSSDFHLYMYDLTAQKRTIKINAHDDDVNTTCFTDDSCNVFCSGSDDCSIRIWDRRCLNNNADKPVGVLLGHADGITCVASKGDGVYLLSNGKDQSMKLWDIRKQRTPEDAASLQKNTASHRAWDYRFQVCPVRMSPASRKSDTSLMTYTGHRVLQTLIRCNFSPAKTTGQQYAYTGSADGSVFIYDLLTGEIVNKLLGHQSIVRDVSWHPEQPLLISSSWDHSVRAWTYSSSSHLPASATTTTSTPLPFVVDEDDENEDPDYANMAVDFDDEDD